MTNMQRIEAVAWIGSAMGLTYGRAAALMTRQEQRTAYKMFAQARKKHRRPYPVPPTFLQGLTEKALCRDLRERENESY